MIPPIHVIKKEIYRIRIIANQLRLQNNVFIVNLPLSINIEITSLLTLLATYFLSHLIFLYKTNFYFVLT